MEGILRHLYYSSHKYVLTVHCFKQLGDQSQASSYE